MDKYLFNPMFVISTFFQILFVNNKLNSTNIKLNTIDIKLNTMDHKLNLMNHKLNSIEKN